MSDEKTVLELETTIANMDFVAGILENHIQAMPVEPGNISDFLSSIMSLAFTRGVQKLAREDLERRFGFRENSTVNP